ncbi:hypothetical protein JCM1393_09450 [Clostridium carnis]
MEIKQKEKVGAGVITISVIHLIFSVFALFGSIMIIFMNDAMNNQMSALGQAKEVTKSQGIISLVFTLALIVSVILLLCKKSIGVYLYFITQVLSIVFTAITEGVSVYSLLGLVMPVLMAIFIFKKKAVYGFGNNIEA